MKTLYTTWYKKIKVNSKFNCL